MSMNDLQKDLAFGWPNDEWTADDTYASIDWIGPSPKPTKAQISSKQSDRIKVDVIDDISNAVQDYMDSEARISGYDSMQTVVTYADEPVDATFKRDGMAFRKWRSKCWRYTYDLTDQYKSGSIPDLVIADVLAGMPKRA